MQLDHLNDAGKLLIERIATFLGVLFGLSLLSSSFPPAYLKGNLPVKGLLIAALAGYFLAIGAALWATQVRFYHRYTFNVTRSQADLAASCVRALCSLDGAAGGAAHRHRLGRLALAQPGGMMLWEVWFSLCLRSDGSTPATFLNQRQLIQPDWTKRDGGPIPFSLAVVHRSLHLFALLAGPAFCATGKHI